VRASTLLSTKFLSKKIQAFPVRYPLADQAALETDQAGERNASKGANMDAAPIVSVGDSAREPHDFSASAMRAGPEIDVSHEAILLTSMRRLRLARHT
jgi:hypothetical protein